MSENNRAKWVDLLPVIQAFIDGKQIQRMGYGGRWEDAKSITSALYNQWRIKPETSCLGTWFVRFQYRQVGSVNGATADGVFEWRGNDDEDPVWPRDSGITLDGVPWFKADELGRNIAGDGGGVK